MAMVRVQADPALARALADEREPQEFFLGRKIITRASPATQQELRRERLEWWSDGVLGARGRTQYSSTPILHAAVRRIIGSG